MEKRKGYRAFITLCLAPAVILFLIFMVVPTVEVFRMSLFKRSAYSQTETFVGLQNFKILLTDANFIRSMQNTILLIVVVTIVTFAFALVFSEGRELQTVPLAIFAIRSTSQTQWGVLIAGLTLAALPMVVVYICLQQYFVDGMNSGAVKG